jgi:hypothetical protein
VGFREDSNQGKKKNIPNGKNSARTGADKTAKMVYVAKRATVKETKKQDMVTTTTMNTEVATEEPKSRKTNKEGTAKQKQHSEGKRENVGDDGRLTDSSNPAGRRRDMHNWQGKRRRYQRGPTKVLKHFDKFTMVNYNMRGINNEEKQQKLY